MVSTPLSPRQSKFVSWGLVLTLVQTLLGVFVFVNAALVEGVMLQYSARGVVRFLVIFILWGVDTVIALLFWFAIITIARTGDLLAKKWFQLINRYWCYCVYGLLKIIIAMYLLLTDVGEYLSHAGYMKWYPVINIIIPTAYLLGTWWLSRRKPDELRSIGKWFVGPRAAHWFDLQSQGGDKK